MKRERAFVCTKPKGAQLQVTADFGVSIPKNSGPWAVRGLTERYRREACSLTDVVAVMHAFPPDVARSLIAARQGDAECFPGRRDTHHAATGGQPFAVSAARSCRMKQRDIFTLGGALQPLDARACFGKMSRDRKSTRLNSSHPSI